MRFVNNEELPMLRASQRRPHLLIGTVGPEQTEVTSRGCVPPRASHVVFVRPHRGKQRHGKDTASAPTLLCFLAMQILRIDSLDVAMMLTQRGDGV